MRVALAVAVLLMACGRTSPIKEPPTQSRYLEGTCPMASFYDFQGVWTNPNPHSKVPAGAARRAENVISQHPGEAECIPGQRFLNEEYGGGWLLSATTYDGHFIEYTSGQELFRRTVSPEALEYIADIQPAGGAQRLQFVKAGGDLYMPTSDGLKVMDGVSASPALAGLPRPLGAQFLGFGKTNVGTGTFLTSSGSQAAYRWLHVRKDAQQVPQKSEPSGRLVFSTGADASNYDVFFKINLTSETVAGDEIWLYRTSFSEAEGVDAGDTMFLVMQHVVSSADVTAKSVTITDSTPDSLRGEPLYTNATGEGILMANTRAPLATVAALFRDYLFLGNTTEIQRLTIRLIAPIPAGDVLTIAGQAYTAKNYTGPTDPDYTAGEFEITVGFPSVSQNIYFTALALIDAINRKTANTGVYAYYASSEIDPPGIIALERRLVTQSVFTAQASAHGGNYEPQLTTAQSSSATVRQSGISVSKKGQHWAFPRSSDFKLSLGSGTRPLLALVALRDSLIGFVEQEGVWRITPAGNDRWRVEQINNNTHLLVPESIAVMDNQAYALATRGVVVVDDSGVEEVDLPIKDKINDILGQDQDALAALTFAVGDDARLRYTLYHPAAGQTASDSAAEHAWIYNADTSTWTERTDAATGGFMGEDDGKLYLGWPDEPFLTQERTGTDAQVFKNPEGQAIPFRLEWTVQSEDNPHSQKLYTEMNLLTHPEKPVTGETVFNFTNDLGGTGSSTGSSMGETYIRVGVPNALQRTSYLRVDIRRDVFEEAFRVVGMQPKAARVYQGHLSR